MKRNINYPMNERDYEGKQRGGTKPHECKSSKMEGLFN